MMETKLPKTIRFAPAEWAPFEEAACARDLEPSVLVRECAFIGLNVLASPRVMEAYCRALSALRRAAVRAGTDESLAKGARR